MTIFSTKFLNTFAGEYLRNNRRGGQKNLRCFPLCSEKGHCSSGFCGRTVTFKVQSSYPELVAKAEFVLDGKYPTDIAVGTVHSRSSIEKQTRGKENPLLRFINGRHRSGDTRLAPAGPFGSTVSVDTLFRFRPSCWHYGWKSNKHATEKLHRLRVYLFSMSKDRTQLTCVGVKDTPAFSLFSSKKLKEKTAEKKKLQEKTAQQKRAGSRKRGAVSAVVSHRSAKKRCGAPHSSLMNPLLSAVCPDPYVEGAPDSPLSVAEFGLFELLGTDPAEPAPTLAPWQLEFVFDHPAVCAEQSCLDACLPFERLGDQSWSDEMSIRNWPWHNNSSSLSTGLLPVASM